MFDCSNDNTQEEAENTTGRAIKHWNTTNSQPNQEVTIIKQERSSQHYEGKKMTQLKVQKFHERQLWKSMNTSFWILDDDGKYYVTLAYEDGQQK